jgi:hypothetical protein
MTVVFPRMLACGCVVCDDCNGRGLSYDETCLCCGGSGYSELCEEHTEDDEEPSN